MVSSLLFFEHYHRRWERRGIFLSSEFKSSANEGDFPFHRVLMPPCGVRPSRNQAYHRCPLEHAFVCLAHKVPNFLSVWRIHPACAVPFLLQRVLLLGEIAFTLCILRSSANIQFEVILRIQPIKEVLRCFPLACRAAGEYLSLHRCLPSCTSPPAHTRR